RKEREHTGNSDRKERGFDSDLERVDAAVAQTDGDVAAVQVRAEDELAAGGEPLRSDRIPGRAEDRLAVRALRDPALREDVDLLPVPRERVRDVVVVRTGMRHVVRIDRS